jgi:hypothetical protein
MKKADKALKEVWKWKEKVYQEYNHLTADEYIRKMKINAEKLLSSNKIKLKEISLEKGHRKIA